MGDEIAVPWWVCLVVAPFVGSLVSVLVMRLPVGEPVVVARSHCPVCRQTLSIRDLVPVFSWVACGGRCRSCGSPISLLYPGLEFGALGVAGWAAAVVPDGWLLWATCGLGWTLMALAVTDLRALVLPDVLTLPLCAAGLAVSVAVDGVQPLDHVIGAGAGFVILWSIAAIYRRARGREGLGMGDAKLLAAAGAWVSWTGLASVVLWAGVSALLVVAVRRLSGAHPERGDVIAFGAHLALGTWLVWLYGPFGSL